MSEKNLPVDCSSSANTSTAFESTENTDNSKVQNASANKQKKYFRSHNNQKHNYSTSNSAVYFNRNRYDRKKLNSEESNPGYIREQKNHLFPTHKTEKTLEASKRFEDIHNNIENLNQETFNDSASSYSSSSEHRKNSSLMHENSRNTDTFRGYIVGGRYQRRNAHVSYRSQRNSPPPSKSFYLNDREQQQQHISVSSNEPHPSMYNHSDRFKKYTNQEDHNFYSYSQRNIRNKKYQNNFRRPYNTDIPRANDQDFYNPSLEERPINLAFEAENKSEQRYRGTRNYQSTNRPNRNSGKMRSYEDKINTERNLSFDISVADRQVSSSRSSVKSSVNSNFSKAESSKKNSVQRFRNTQNHQSTKKYKEITATQRDMLIHQLQKGECECMVCCESIQVRDHTWNCISCYHVFHLRCIRKWARSPAAVVEGDGWRCPACQNKTKDVPYNYYCFCGKCKDPEVNYHYTPHSCGEVCGKKRDENCPHVCNLLCHPGPCPACTAVVTRLCACGKTKKSMQCHQDTPFTCNSVCDKLLNCGIHRCTETCHIGNCEPCTVIYTQECFCKKNKREVLCDGKNSEFSQYSCGMPCEKTLDCSHHHCSSTCHPGSCGTCPFSVKDVTTCPCGKTALQELYSSGKANQRTSCNDSIPVCEAKCDKVLNCGPKDSPHRCEQKCHLGDCPSCPLVTNVKCRCGSTTKEYPCSELSSVEFLCEKRCNKRKDCGRHKCLNLCCINSEHKCELVCNKKLSCGSHHCQETCHMGNCPPCWNVSFNELRCYCGESVIYPPIHCGTKPPECNQPCTRQHTCDHKVQHNCHSDETCPPCTALTDKWCFGHHELRSNVQCFLDGISCGKPCGKPLPCGEHTCQEICHLGPCLKEGEKCKQLCTKIRSSCSHPCAVVCHDGPCPDTPCRAKMNVSCPCGHRSEIMTCTENSKAFRLISVSVLASKIQDIKAGESVNINDFLGKKNKNNKLQCNEECAVIERNKRLAVALQIRNPDLSCKPGPPNYSDFLKEETKKNPKFIEQVYNKLTELVQLAKQSKQKSRSHAFPPMNRDQRRVIHELAEFFGCETQSYDEEPVKNVVVTAFREKSWLPFGSIMTVVERDMKLRRGPVPVIANNNHKVKASQIDDKKEQIIDYFDYS